MTILIIGKNGQLAWELQQTAPASLDVRCLGSDELDITDGERVAQAVREIAPTWVINASAYTAVDKAESEPGRAHDVNGLGVQSLASACLANNAKLVHVSTDFVFDGKKSRPYHPEDLPNPTGIYGASKLTGETAVRAVMPDTSTIVRTSWVYSAHGNNFVKTMLRLMGDKPQLGVVADQVGTPTWAKGLAEFIWALVDKGEVTGIHHWSDAGVASWYDFAVAIQELGLEKGLLDKAIPIKAITTEDYPTPAKRPAYSVLDKASAIAASGVEPTHWRKQLSAMLDELTQS